MTAQVKPLTDDQLRILRDVLSDAPTDETLPLGISYAALLATISDLQEKLRVASAREAVLQSAIRNSAYEEGEDWWHCCLCEGCGESPESIAHEDDCPAHDPSPAAQALLDNQRTPGTVEVCEKCGFGDGNIINGCHKNSCPIRKPVG